MSARAIVTGPGRLQMLEPAGFELKTGAVVVLEVLEGGRSPAARTALELGGLFKREGSEPLSVEEMNRAVLDEAARLHRRVGE